MKLVLLLCLLGEAFHFDSMHYLLESAAIVEQCDSEQEEAQTIKPAYDPVESCEPSVFLLRVGAFAR